MMRSNAITYMLSCILGGKYLHLIGREISIIVGLVFIFVQQLGLWYLSSFNNATAFLIASFIA